MEPRGQARGPLKPAFAPAFRIDAGGGMSAGARRAVPLLQLHAGSFEKSDACGKYSKIRIARIWKEQRGIFQKEKQPLY